MMLNLVKLVQSYHTIHIETVLILSNWLLTFYALYRVAKKAYQAAKFLIGLFVSFFAWARGKNLKAPIPQWKAKISRAPEMTIAPNVLSVQPTRSIQKAMFPPSSPTRPCSSSEHPMLYEVQMDQEIMVAGKEP